MLSCLRVRNFAIIDELEVELGPGLNVVTGETGAGKSILIDALGLVLGDKARNDLVRSGAPHAEVEALFDLGDPEALRERLVRAGLGAAAGPAEGDEGDEGGAPSGSTELVIRRVITAQGRSRAYVNGQLATLAQLSALAAGLADISSQHEHHTLVDAGSHLAYLDAFGGLEERAAAMRAAHAQLADASAQLDAARGRLRGRSDRSDFLTFQIGEIDAIAPVPGELARLHGDRERLRHAERLLRAAAQAEESIYGRDGSITEELGRLASALRDAATLDAALAPALAAIEQAEAQLSDAARDLGQYTRNLSIDPERLADVEERLHALSRLAKKYAPSGAAAGEPEEAILAHREAAASELRELTRAEDEIAALERARDAAHAHAAEQARGLSRRRKDIAASLSRGVGQELRSLGMGTAEIRIDVSPLDGKGEGLVDGARLSPTGIDRVEILIAPNAGEEPKPLRRIASGGELSRALLAIKRVLADSRRGAGSDGGAAPSTRPPTGRSLYVFDEVDTGVGGAVAETIGQKLRAVAGHDQVLCITHLAPIAIYADTHFLVKKEVVMGRTRSDILPIAGPERVEEIARMLGGLTVTKKTREVAAELLRGAHPAT